MPSLSELPGEIKRRKFTKALERLGFVINRTGGKGDHYKAIWRNGKAVVIQCELRKDVLYYLLKEIELISGITWEDIKNKL
ncbi:MAG: hypothetical protein Q8P06_00740 [Candidatus Azambacteria bacterium]|nr:hypothetical protein [Candidatus Azambacteria bacterium]